MDDESESENESRWKHWVTFRLGLHAGQTADPGFDSRSSLDLFLIFFCFCLIPRVTMVIIILSSILPSSHCFGVSSFRVVSTIIVAQPILWVLTLSFFFSFPAGCVSDPVCWHVSTSPPLGEYLLLFFFSFSTIRICTIIPNSLLLCFSPDLSIDPTHLLWTFFPFFSLRS